MTRSSKLLTALLIGLSAAGVSGCAEGDGGGAEGRGRRGGEVVGSDRIGVEARLAPAFSGDRALALLERQVAFGPRVPGSPGHAAQLEWMRSYLRERADTVIEQPFTHAGPDGETLELTNLFARFGLEHRDRVLLLAHWDTRPTADADPDPELRDRPIDGANDGASGVAVLLHLAEILARRAAPIGVDLLLTDGEDYAPGHMYLGAQWFADHRPPAYEPFYGILLDMVGDRDPRFPREGYSRQYAPEVVERVWRMAERLGYGHLFVASPGGYVTDDHVPLNEVGIRTINIIDFDFGPANAYWHTHQDDLDNVGPDGLEAVGTVLAELIYRGG